MTSADHRIKAKRLIWAWLIVSIVTSFFCKLYVETQGIGYLTATNVPLAYTLVITVLSIFVIIPLLSRINYHAQKANMKKTAVFSRTLLVVHILWIVLLVLEKIWSF